MKYDIVSTGSQGNCLIIGDTIAVDCGVSLKSLRPWVKRLKLVLLTHAHQDHFNRTTINAIHNLRPTIRFAVPPWLYYRRVDNIDVCAMDTWYDYGIARVQPFELFHDMGNCGWRIEYGDKCILYATDTNRIDHIAAPDYDYYFIEANHDEGDIKERILAKESAGEFAYERRVMHTHLSRDKADKWLMENASDTSIIEYMHQHKEE